jgi:hypothetical protein
MFENIETLFLFFVIHFLGENATNVVPTIVVVDTTDGIPQTAVIASATASASTSAASRSTSTTITVQDVSEENETENDEAPLIPNEPMTKFKFAFSHLTCLGIGMAHMAWMAFGTFLTVPMYFRYLRFASSIIILH